MSDNDLEQMLLMKGELCQGFAQNNVNLYCTLYNQDWLIYKVIYNDNRESGFILDTTRPFPLNVKDYNKVLNEALNDGRDLIEMDYWRA